MINLLPPEEKEILLKERQFREILILEVLIFLFFLLLILVLFSIKLELKGRIVFQKTILEQKQLVSESSKIKALEQKINSSNQTLSRLAAFYRDDFYLSDVFEEISKTIPPRMYLTNFSYNREKKEISLSGFSPNRQILSEFKENLERSGWFHKIYFPASNWIKPADIDFFVSFEIRND